MTQLTAAAAMQRAVQHHQAGRLVDAERMYRQVLVLHPDHPGALHALGVLAYHGGLAAAAVDLIGRSVRVRPEHAGAHNDLGNALRQQGQFADAAAAYRQAIQLRPDWPVAHYNLGIALRRLGHLDDAVSAYRSAIALKDDYSEAHNNLGYALREKGCLDDAAAAYRRAIELQPANAEIRCNLGVALRELGHIDEAVAEFRRAIELKGNLPEAHADLGFALLCKGDFAGGWPELEWRWRCRTFPVRPDITLPRWDGGPLNGRTLLLHTEPGFGDTIQFIRYIPLLADRGGEIVVDCQRELLRLFSGSWGIKHWVARAQPRPHCDVHCPLMSLPLLMGTTVQTIPNQVPYVHVPSDVAEPWRDAIVPDPGRLHVALVWAAGHPSRSMPLELLAPLAQVSGVTFHSLQKGPAATQAKNPPQGMTLIDHSEKIHDFADTAALIAQMDLVIAIDTAVGHLAGAMGKPVWTLRPFVPPSGLLWLADRSDNPWYPTMRVFIQPSPGDWGDVAQRVAADLGALAAGRRG